MVKVPCDMCKVNCGSISSLTDHMMGRKHKSKLQSSVPEEVKQLGRLQYFLDRHVKHYPILGLEHVVEKRRDSAYIYSCTLCNVEGDWQKMALHVLGLAHTKGYMVRHHSEMTGSATMIDSQVRQIAQMIHNKYGRREIHLEHAVDTLARPKVDAIEDKDALPSTSDDLVTKCKTMTQEPVKSTLYYHCRFCTKKFTSANALCQHMLSKKHKNKLGTLLPEHLKGVDRVNYFLGAEMKDVPILGLEYIVQRKVDSSCDFSCQLCGVDTNMQHIIFHILRTDHMDCYMRKHHSDLVIGKQQFNEKSLYWNTMKHISAMILERHEHKEIQVKNSITDGPGMAESLSEGDCKTRRAFGDEESATLPSNHDSGNTSHSESSSRPCLKRGLDESHESYSYEMMVEKSEIDGPPSAKRGRPNPEGDQDALPSRSHISECRSSQDESHDKERNNTTPAQELEFTTNDQFYEYLANFVIKNDEDADFVQKIIKNCKRAWMSFQEEEKKSNHEPETSLVHISRTDQETLDISVSKAKSYPSAPESTLPKDVSDPFTDTLWKNNIIDFFNHIKHMDESEVVDIFKKIATTNPEFQGMNIPTVIRFLKNSGRLKNA